MTDKLLAFRSEFPILERTNYLVSNSLGPMPRGVERELQQYTKDWREYGVKAWARGWWEKAVDVGNEIAPLINAGPGTVVMIPNVTYAQSIVLSALDFKSPRDTIVMTDMDFPSVRYASDALARKFGARVVVVPSEDGITIDQEALLAAIDERTCLVSISHVLFKSAFINDAKAIVDHAHRMGALVSLDAFHSVGIIPVDVQESGVDFLTGGVLKWLCGGPGSCFLYVSPAHRDTLEPALTGWQAHARPFAFEEEMDMATGPFRWLNGTPVIPALYAAVEGPRILLRAGVDEIRRKSRKQTARMIDLADSRGYRVNAPRDPDKRGGTVAIDVPNGYEVTQVLLAQDILVDYRVGAGIRAAPFFFTTDDEVSSLFAAIDESIESGSWRAHTARKTVVT